MKYLICGGRDFKDRQAFNDMMARAAQDVGQPTLIIEGGAEGADRMGRNWAIERGIHYATVPALWGVYDLAAGPLRNSAMILLQPDVCVAMPGGTGTWDMVQRYFSNSVRVFK